MAKPTAGNNESLGAGALPTYSVYHFLEPVTGVPHCPSLLLRSPGHGEPGHRQKAWLPRPGGPEKRWRDRSSAGCLPSGPGSSSPRLLPLRVRDPGTVASGRTGKVRGATAGATVLCSWSFVPTARRLGFYYSMVSFKEGQKIYLLTEVKPPHSNCGWVTWHSDLVRTFNAQILHRCNGPCERLLNSTAGKRGFIEVPRALSARSTMALPLRYLVEPRELRGGIMAVGGWLGNLLLLRSSLTSCLCDTNELKSAVLRTLQVSLTTCVSRGKVPHQTRGHPLRADAGFGSHHSLGDVASEGQESQALPDGRKHKCKLRNLCMGRELVGTRNCLHITWRSIIKTKTEAWKCQITILCAWN